MATLCSIHGVEIECWFFSDTFLLIKRIQGGESQLTRSPLARASHLALGPRLVSFS